MYAAGTPLPDRWAADELIQDERDRWRAVGHLGDDTAACVLFDPVPDAAGAAPDGRMLLALGETEPLIPLIERAADHSLVSAWIATEALPHVRDLLAGLGLRPNRTGWEWMVIREAPTDVAAESHLRRLVPADRDAALTCLAVSNPSTEAVPVADGECWWGVDDGHGELLGVIGAEPRPGAVDGRGSWHLHGLGVRPEARGQGLGGALTAGAARALLAEGADWVSLGMWDDNHGARRIYHRLGFRTVQRLVTLHRR